jgi:uncharacterized protein YgiM (DUF1202 family)
MTPLKSHLPAGAAGLCGTFLAGAALGMAAAAAVVYVAADRLDIVDKKRTVANVVATVDKNTALTVVAQEGKWYKVDVNGKQGYVFEKAVSSQPGGKKAEGVALSSVKGGEVAGLEQAAAIRGANPVTEKYASSKGLSSKGLKQLFAERASVTPPEYDRFQAEGGLRGAQAAADAGQTDNALASSGSLK